MLPFATVAAGTLASVIAALQGAPASAPPAAAPPAAAPPKQAPAPKVTTPPAAAPKQPGTGTTAPATPAASDAPDTTEAVPTKGKKPREAGFWFGVPAAPAKAPGAIRIAAYNTENLFDDKDDPTLSGEFDDIKMVTKPARLAAIADAIKRLDADVLSIEEIESIDALKWFRDNYLKDLGYQYFYSEDVGYYRGVEQAFLSRYPIKAHETFVKEDLSDMEAKRAGSGWAAKKPDQGQKFQRSPLKIEVDVKGYPLTLYSVHLKAGGKEFEFQRESEALQTIQFIQEALAKDPGANVAVMGDFNSAPGGKVIKTFGDAGFRGAYDFRATKKGNTKDLYTTHDSGRTLDYIFMTPGLSADVVNGSFFVLSTVHPSSEYDWKTDPEKEKVPAGYASDHYPVAIDIMPKDKPVDAVKADAVKPGAAKPDGSKPASVTPGASTPGTAKPDAGKPDPAKPNAGERSAALLPSTAE